MMVDTAELTSGRYDSTIMSTGFQRDPFETYNEIRESAPVYWCEPWSAWLITRYDDVVWALRDSDVWSNENRHSAFMKDLAEEDGGEAIERRSSATTSMLDMDPPGHTRLRKLSSGAFTPRSVQALAPQVAEEADRLLAGITARSTFDFIETIARPLPALVIARMFGLPQEDHQLYLRWVRDVINYWTVTPPTAESADLMVRASQETDVYFQDWIRRVHDDPPDTILGDLIRIHDGGDRLAYQELVTYCGMLLHAASDTTKAFIGDATASLLADPALLRRVRADRTLIPAVVQESLRHDTPLLRAPRVLKVDVDLHGSVLHAGDLAFVIMAAANRDPRMFDDPNRFDIDRPNLSANVAFGHGRHHCIGASIARLEAEIVIERLLDNFSDIELAEVAWQPSFLMRTPERLQLAVRGKKGTAENQDPGSVRGG